MANRNWNRRSLVVSHRGPRQYGERLWMDPSIIWVSMVIDSVASEVGLSVGPAEVAPLVGQGDVRVALSNCTPQPTMIPSGDCVFMFFAG